VRLALITDHDSSDARAYSGIGFHMARSLDGAGAEVVRLVLCGRRTTRAASALRKVVHELRGTTYIGGRNRARLRSYVQQAGRMLAGEDCDAVLATNTTPVAHLSCERPIVIWTDSTARGLIGFYPRHSRLAKRTIQDSLAADRLSLERCDLAIFSSQWAADIAVDTYGVPSSKGRVVPFGANIESGMAADDAAAVVRSRPRDVCRMLFIGTDWARKGGEHALAVLTELRRRGVRSELTVIGPAHSALDGVPDGVRVLGAVPMSTPAGRETIETALAGLHFLLPPTPRGLLPDLARRGQLVRRPVPDDQHRRDPDGREERRHGRMFDPSAAPGEYADYIVAMLADQRGYERLALRAHAEYAQTLNWRTAASTVLEMMERL
jgi:hypothetical protein